MARSSVSPSSAGPRARRAASRPNHAELRALREAASAAVAHAYAPYSKFCVGAAALMGSGRIYAGCNVENASYGLTICAERAALFAAVAAGERELRAIALFTPTLEPSAPCGACRQVLNEFGPRCFVLSFCNGSGRLETTLDALLPVAFGPRQLSKEKAPRGKP